MKSSVKDKIGNTLILRTLMQTDTEALSTFFDSISTASRSAFYPHPFTVTFAQKICADNTSITHLRMAAFNSDATKDVVGYAFITRPPFVTKSGFFGIVVADRAQGRGISTILMRALFEHARSKGVKTIYLNVFTNNAPAVHVYEKLGFVRTAQPFLLSKFIMLYELFYNRSLTQSKRYSTDPIIWMVKRQI